jgi:hypothetical protein
LPRVVPVLCANVPICVCRETRDVDAHVRARATGPGYEGAKVGSVGARKEWLAGCT